MKKRIIKNLVKTAVKKYGYEIHKGVKKEFPTDFSDEHITIIRAVKPYTITSNERIFELIESVKYISKNNIDGAIVECGVFRGGSMMTVAKTLLGLGLSNRDLYLFDTFEGMTKPTIHDENWSNLSALEEYSDKEIGENQSDWCRATLDVVKNNMNLTGYDASKIHFVKGMVEKTVPDRAPDKIALLRLDTDWYESTKHELEFLFPRLVKGGVLIIDDYGYWKGQQKAVDEYFANNTPPFFNYTDFSGRIALKL